MLGVMATQNPWPRYFRCVGDGCSRVYRQDAAAGPMVRVKGRKGRSCRSHEEFFPGGCNLVPSKPCGTPAWADPESKQPPGWSDR